jgi:integrase
LRQLGWKRQCKEEEVPGQVIMKDRQVVDTRSNVWRFRASLDGGKIICLNWQLFPGHASPLVLHPSVVQLVQAYLSSKMRYSKGSSIRNDFIALGKLLKWAGANLPCDSLTEFKWEMLRARDFRLFLESGLQTSSRGNDFAHVRDFYSWCCFVAEADGFEPQLALSLKNVKAQGNVKGAAVRFRDPVRGPLHSDDKDSLIRAVRSDCGAPEDRALIMLHLELGVNPNSTARMKNSDLTKFTVNTVLNGQSRSLTRYQLAVPRVKKRTEHRQTKLRPISQELGNLLESLRAGNPDDRLFYWLDENNPEAAAARGMARFAADAQIASTQTGTLLRLSPRRFRYTLASEAAKEGASPAKIAELLDHSDLQNVKVYIEASSDVVDQLADKFDSVFIPVARHFKGKIIDQQKASSTTANVVPATSPHLPLLNVGGIGMCGRDVRKDGICNLAPPLTCYACEFFAAFRGGPHEEVVQVLEDVQSELKASSDLRIPMQLDTVIRAARQLLSQIQAEASERNE